MAQLISPIAEHISLNSHLRVSESLVSQIQRVCGETLLACLYCDTDKQMKEKKNRLSSWYYWLDPFTSLTNGHIMMTAPVSF